jgi:N-acetylmuramoyl-L-alanine amidase
VARQRSQEPADDDLLETSDDWEEAEDEGDERLPGDPADDHGIAAGAREPEEEAEEPAPPRAVQHKAASPEYPTPPCTVVVGPGDCIASLAKRYRRLPDQIWNAPENAELKRTRKQNLLLPGDRVFVPDVVRKQVDGASEKRHRFKLKTPTTSLKLKLLREAKPRANLDYVVEIGDKSFEGKTGADGALEVKIPADATRGTLRLLDPAGEETYPLELGDLNPVEDVTGVQARLNNLGFAAGATDGEVGPRTRGAIAAFQRANGMRLTGEIDDALRSKLVERHGS